MHQTSFHLQVYEKMWSHLSILKNLSVRSFHVVMEEGGREFNYTFVQWQSIENGKSLSLNAFCNAPAILKPSLSSIKRLRWMWGSSYGSPLNYSIVWSIWNIIGLSLKLITCTSGLTIPGFMPWGVNTA